MNIVDLPSSLSLISIWTKNITYVTWTLSRWCWWWRWNLPPIVEQLAVQLQQQIGKWGRGLSWYNPCPTALPPQSRTHRDTLWMMQAACVFYFRTEQFVFHILRAGWGWKLRKMEIRGRGQVDKSGGGGEQVHRREGRGSERDGGEAGEGAEGGGRLRLSSPLTHCCS